jgi:hypothetical protein
MLSCHQATLVTITGVHGQPETSVVAQEMYMPHSGGASPKCLEGPQQSLNFSIEGLKIYKLLML